MITDINSEDRLVQKTVSDYLQDKLGWETAYAWNDETFGPAGMLGRASEQDAVLVRDLKAAIARINPELPESARNEALTKITRIDYSRSLLQQNHEFYGFIRNGVPVSWRDAQGETQHAFVKVIDFRNGETSGQPNNRFLAVRELKLQGARVPHYNRRADVVCFVNGLPLVFIELKAVYRNIRMGFDNNLTDYMTEQVVPHAFHHNAFLIVSNGHRARYGSITSKWEHFAEWKRNDEKQKGDVDAKMLLDGMLSHDRLLDIVENFILFDASRLGGTRKIVARNHQVLGVNQAVESVKRQETLKLKYPQGFRLTEYQTLREPMQAHAAENAPDTISGGVQPTVPDPELEKLFLVKKAHSELGQLGVFWHTQGSGKSYSMAFFAEKVRRVVPGNFTFLLMTDREDLDDQIFRTFVGCGVADEKTPRASSGQELKSILQENHRFIFSLVHKFNQDVSLNEPYSNRDDIIIISDEAHRTQAGKLARNMRMALPNASFIGFTGTPIFKHDEITKRIFGKYISRYDFKRSEEDKSTVRLVYENRGEKLGIARLDLNDRIAEKIEQADLDADQQALLERLLGQDYEIITADDRLDKIADDFVEHCSIRWESGKSLLVCIDKVTCARMYQRIIPRWQAKITGLKARIPVVEAEVSQTTEKDIRERKSAELDKLRSCIAWMESTIIEIIISEAQNEVRDFKKWNFDIVPHRSRIKLGFEAEDGKTVPVDDAFKEPEHPFRIAIVCAMWLTGFDVECLSTLYIDKPMKAHTLMQAIARANRIYPGKDCGVIVDYNGMLKSLREALAQYALGDGDDEKPGTDIVIPIEDQVNALLDAIEAAEDHLKKAGFDASRLIGSKGFDRIQLFKDAEEALYASDDTKQRFEIIAREMFSRFKALLIEPSVYQYSERHDNIETIYKKLQERRDTADVTEVLKGIHRIVNEAIRTSGTGVDHTEGLKVDLSKIDFEKLQDEFASKIRCKHTALQDIREVVEAKLMEMLARNPLRMDYYKKYQDIIADYNREKDRVTVETTFTRLADFAQGLDAEQQRAVAEGLDEDELALFDLLYRTDISKADRERLKQASKALHDKISELLMSIGHWTKNAQTQAEVESYISDWLYQYLPRPPFTDTETLSLVKRVYDYAWQRSEGGHSFRDRAHNHH